MGKVKTNNQHSMSPITELYPSKIYPGFLDKHPKAFKALGITMLAIGILATLAVLGLIIAGVVTGALPLFLAAGAGLGVLMGSIVLGGKYLASMSASRRLASKRAEASPDSHLTVHMNYLETRLEEHLTTQLNLAVDRLANLQLELTDSQKEIIEVVDGSRDIVNLANQATGFYRSLIDLVRQRKEMLGPESRVVGVFPRSSHVVRTRDCITMCNDLTDKLMKAGGAFSLKVNTLSKRMQKVYLGMTVGVTIGAIACIAALIVVTASGGLALPIFFAAILGIGMAAIALSYAFKALLKHSRTNRLILIREMQKSFDMEHLKEVTLKQLEVLKFAWQALEDEHASVMLDRQLFKFQADLQDYYDNLTGHYNSLCKDLEKIVSENDYKVIRDRLELFSDFLIEREVESAKQGSQNYNEVWKRLLNRLQFDANSEDVVSRLSYSTVRRWKYLDYQELFKEGINSEVLRLENRMYHLRLLLDFIGKTFHENAVDVIEAKFRSYQALERLHAAKNELPYMLKDLLVMQAKLAHFGDGLEGENVT